MVVLNTQMQPTHFLRACICWCALDLIISIHVLITPYPYALCDVYNAAPACIIYSYSCPSLCIHTYTLLLRTYSTTRSSSLCMCTHILLLLVYYTVHAPYHHYVVLCHVLHISMCAPKYIHTYTYYRHNMSSDMSSYHLIIYDTMYHHLRYLLHGMLCHYTLRSIYATLPPYLYTQIPWYGVSIWTSRPPPLDIDISSDP